MNDLSRIKELKSILGSSVSYVPNELNRISRLLLNATFIEHHDKKIESHSGLGCFVALAGSRVNGEDFVPNLLPKLSAAIVSSSFPRLKKELEKKIIRVKNPYKILAPLSAWFYKYPSRQIKLIGITGTNGKTTISYLLEILYRQNNKRVAIIGTLGIKLGNEIIPLNNTTPNALDLQKILYELLKKKVEVVIMEVSSHALKLGRVSCLDFDQIIFSNLSQDHLDFHRTMTNYFKDKFKIFELLNQSCKPFKKAVIGIDSLMLYWNEKITAKMKRFDFEQIYLTGKNNRQLKINLNFRAYSALLVRYKHSIHSQLEKNKDCLEMSSFSEEKKSISSLSINTTLIGTHNMENLALALCTYFNPKNFSQIEVDQNFFSSLYIPGRMEEYSFGSKKIFIDYAHTPEALKVVLKAFKKYKKKIICVFGCGGNRDKGKRKLMGKVSSQYADHVILTDDNPRDEPSEKIINDIRSGMTSKVKVEIEVIPERKKAIETGIRSMSKDHLLLIAGKGHETYQIIRDRTYPFSDQKIVKDFLKKMWQSKFSKLILKYLKNVSINYRFSDQITKEIIDDVGIDSRTITANSVFFTIDGTKYRGIHFLDQVIDRGVKIICLSKKDLKAKFTFTGKSDLESFLKSKNIFYFIVEDTKKTLAQLAKVYLKQHLNLFPGKIIAITGSAGKTTVKESLSYLLSRRFQIFKSRKNENNEIGIPLNIFRIKQPYDFYLFELGTNHRGEIAHLSEIVQPHHTIITNILPSHIGNFKSLEEIAIEKTMITKYQRKNGYVFFPENIELKKTIYQFLNPSVSPIEFSVEGKVNFKISKNKKIKMTYIFAKEEKESHHHRMVIPGINFFVEDLISIMKKFQKSLLPGKSDLFYNLTLPAVERRMEIVLEEKSSPLIIDDAYNANPFSMTQSVKKLLQWMGNDSSPAINRIHLVLGDMFELGDHSKSFHHEVVESVLNTLKDLSCSSNGFVNFLYLTGPMMSQVATQLSPQFKKHHLFLKNGSFSDIQKSLLKNVTPQSLCYFKASNGMHFDKLIQNFITSLKNKTLTI